MELCHPRTTYKYQIYPTPLDSLALLSTLFSQPNTVRFKNRYSLEIPYLPNEFYIQLLINRSFIMQSNMCQLRETE